MITSFSDMIYILFFFFTIYIHSIMFKSTFN